MAKKSKDTLPIYKVPHSICAYYAVKMLRDRLEKMPKKNWVAFLVRVENNINRKWKKGAATKAGGELE